MSGTTDEKALEKYLNQREAEYVKKFAIFCELNLIPVCKELAKNIKALAEAILNSYPNKRVLHLAKYHPKERVRKKNMRRVLKWIERGL